MARPLLPLLPSPPASLFRRTQADAQYHVHVWLLILQHLFPAPMMRIKPRSFTNLAMLQELFWLSWGHWLESLFVYFIAVEVANAANSTPAPCGVRRMFHFWTCSRSRQCARFPQTYSRSPLRRGAPNHALLRTRLLGIPRHLYPRSHRINHAQLYQQALETEAS